MHTVKHILTKSLALLLVVTVLLPATVKAMHVFENHKHEVCTEKTSDHHLHQIDVDCEFYKFKLSNTYYDLPLTFDITFNDNFYSTSYHYYKFLFNHQQTYTYLRGPPSC